MVFFKVRKKLNNRIETEAQLRSHRCAFTGHRPEKVVGYEGRIIVELIHKEKAFRSLADVID